jgi:CelD/BcsL family acetyltransferase involved in cellulose biosynthesis
MAIRIEVVDSDSAFTQLEAEWNALLARSATPRLFMTWDWLFTWWGAYRPGELLILTLRNEAHQLIGLAPWFVHHGEIHMLGCVEVTDYTELILQKGCESEALQALTNWLKAHEADYHQVTLCNIPAASPTLHWRDSLEAAGYPVSVEVQEVCPVLALPASFEAYLEGLDKKERGEIRRKLRHARGHEGITWGYIDPQGDLEPIIERLFALMSASSPQKEAFLKNPAHVTFFRRLIPLMAAKGWLALSFLQVNGKDAAAYLSFDDGQQILLYNSGYNPKVAPDLSPGIVLLTYIIRDAIEKQRTLFDFLRGNETYKYRMGGQDTPVYRLRVSLA